MDRVTEIENVKLLSHCNLDVTTLATASMDTSLPSIGISAASSLARTSLERPKKGVEKNNGTNMENEKIRDAVAITEKVDLIKKGVDVKEQKVSEGGIEEGDMKLMRNGKSKDVEELEKNLPASPSLITIPNQYCSLIEAQELRQLLSIPTGNYVSWIVPSSVLQRSCGKLYEFFLEIMQMRPKYFSFFTHLLYYCKMQSTP